MSRRRTKRLVHLLNRAGVSGACGAEEGWLSQAGDLVNFARYGSSRRRINTIRALTAWVRVHGPVSPLYVAVDALLRQSAGAA